MHPVDLRSDIISTPTEAMIQAMAEAARKPRGFGMREDADQKELEELSAGLLGFEDALFFPTCTMANQVALMLHCPRGHYVLADRDAHLCNTEGPSTAGISGATLTTLIGEAGAYHSCPGRGGPEPCAARGPDANSSRVAREHAQCRRRGLS